MTDTKNVVKTMVNAVKSAVKPVEKAVTKPVKAVKAVKAVKRVGRNAVDAQAKKAITKGLKKRANTGIATTASDSVKAITALKLDACIEAGLKRGKSCNVLGHVISGTTGGKNVLIDHLLLSAGNQPLTIQHVYDVLVSQKVVGGKQFTAKAMLAKWRAHGKHFEGKGKVSYEPIKQVDSKLLSAVHAELTPFVEIVLKG